MTAETYEKKKQVFGQEGVIAVQVDEKIAGGNVKIVLDTPVTSNDGTSSLGPLIAGFLSKKITKTEKGPDT
jgi:hypothetical protein